MGGSAMKAKPQNGQNDKNEALIRILRGIDRGDDPRTLRAEAHRLIREITPRDLARAEQRLVRTGTPSRQAGQLSVAFLLMGVLDGKDVHLRDRLPADHVLRIILAEHELTRCFLADLDSLVHRIAGLDHMTDTSIEFMRLSHIAEHLYAMLEHIEREDDILFPSLRRQGWSALSDAPDHAHERIRNDVDTLLRLLGTFRAEKFVAFKRQLMVLSDALIQTILEHLHEEDNLLFPIALEVVKDPAVWRRIKQLCDEIGYCGMHL